MHWPRLNTKFSCWSLLETANRLKFLSYKLVVEIMKKMRLNKFISHNANYSRREADELIGQGKENQHRAISDSATSVGENDNVKISGRFAKLKKNLQ